MADYGAFAALTGKQDLNKSLSFMNNFNPMPIISQPHPAFL